MNLEQKESTAKLLEQEKSTYFKSLEEEVR